MNPPTSSYNSTWVINQDPTRFGNQQDDYIEKSNEEIHLTAEKIINAKKQNTDLKKLFYEIDKNLSGTRARIAQLHRTEDAKSFGWKRAEYYPGTLHSLTLGGIYKTTNAKLLNFFSHHLQAMESNSKFKNVDKTNPIEDRCNGRLSTMEIEVLNASELETKGYTRWQKNYLPKNISYEKLARKDEEWTAEEMVDYRKKFQEFKQNNPKDYLTSKIAYAVQKLDAMNPGPRQYNIAPEKAKEYFSEADADVVLGNMKSLYVRAVLRTEIDKKLISLTEYYLWMYEDGEWLNNKTATHHPVERMKKYSKVLLLHQDEFLINQTLDEIATVFEAVVSWKRGTQTEDELKDNMALLYYLLAHNMRDVRGSAAETEWLEAAIYLALGFEIPDRSHQMLDLEAFGSPFLSTFTKTYHELTILLAKPTTIST